MTLTYYTLLQCFASNVHTVTDSSDSFNENFYVEKKTNVERLRNVEKKREMENETKRMEKSFTSY